jgi:hypothetical protein
MHEENFVDFTSMILEHGQFRSFGTLVFLSSRFRPPSASRKYWEEIWEGDPDRRDRNKMPCTAWECVQQWIADIGVQEYLCVHESRGEETRYHMLVDDFGAFDDTSRDRWKEISGGWASERQLDDRIGRLIGHMVMRKGKQSCKVKTSLLSFNFKLPSRPRQGRRWSLQAPTEFASRP